MKLTDALPAGTSFERERRRSLRGRGRDLEPRLALSGQSGSQTLVVSTATDGTYTNVAKLFFAHLVVGTVVSDPVVTQRDTVPPLVTIPVPPNVTALATATRRRSRSTSSTHCPRPQGAGWTGRCSSCASRPSRRANPLEGPHTLDVRATDDAGNEGQASLQFLVDVTPPSVTILAPPANEVVTSDTTPTLLFSISAGGSPTHAVCRIVSPPSTVVASGPCDPPSYTASTLAEGPYVFVVVATDEAGNSTTISSRSWSTSTTLRRARLPPRRPSPRTPCWRSRAASCSPSATWTRRLLRVTLSVTHGTLSMSTISV